MKELFTNARAGAFAAMVYVLGLFWMIRSRGILESWSELLTLNLVMTGIGSIMIVAGSRLEFRRRRAVILLALCFFSFTFGMTMFFYISRVTEEIINITMMMSAGFIAGAAMVLSSDRPAFLLMSIPYSLPSAVYLVAMAEPRFHLIGYLIFAYVPTMAVFNHFEYERRKKYYMMQSVLRDQIETSFRYSQNLQVKEQEFELQLSMAADIQRSIMPRRYQKWFGMEMAVFSFPMSKVSGDYYDIISTENHLFVLLADAAGHGIPAALVTMAAKQAFTSFIRDDREPGEILHMVNESMAGRVSMEEYLTAFLLRIEKDGNISYCNAAHRPALVLRENSGALEQLDSAGYPLGIRKNPVNPYETRKTKIQPGDRLLLYTDGIVEQTNEAGESFGVNRLGSLFADLKAMSLQDFNDSLVIRLQDHRGLHPLTDDVTMVSLEFKKEWVVFKDNFIRAMESWHKREHKEALEKFITADGIIPDVYQAKFMIARCYFDLRDYSSSSETLEAILSAHPRDIPSLVLLTETSMKMRNPVKARGTLFRITELEPGHPQIRELEKMLEKL